MKLWDFTKVVFITSNAMRYDTPGDWYGDVIEAWVGLGRIEYILAVQLHEFTEAVMLLAAGITPDMIDILDTGTEEEKTKILPWVKSKYEMAHNLSLLIEREFIEGCGLNWKEYDDFIESTQGKIPIRKQVS